MGITTNYDQCFKCSNACCCRSVRFSLYGTELFQNILFRFGNATVLKKIVQLKCWLWHFNFVQLKRETKTKHKIIWYNLNLRKWMIWPNWQFYIRLTFCGIKWSNWSRLIRQIRLRGRGKSYISNINFKNASWHYLSSIISGMHYHVHYTTPWQL